MRTINVKIVNTSIEFTDLYKASTPKEGISDTCPLYATNIVNMVADVGEFGYYCFEVVGGKGEQI